MIKIARGLITNPSPVDILICQHDRININVSDNTGRLGRFDICEPSEQGEESCAVQDKNVDWCVGHADLLNVVVTTLRLLLHTQGQ